MSVQDHTTAEDFFAPEVVADPYPLLERLRGIGPVVHHEAMDLWMVIGFDDIKWCAARPHVFEFPAEWQVGTFGVNVMQGFDDERHDAIRAVWSPDFNRRHVQGYRAMITPMVAELVEAFAERVRAGEAVDLVDAVTRRIPTFVITELMGIGPERRAEYSRWSDEMARIPQAMIDSDPRRRERTLAEAFAARDEMLDALRAEIARRDGVETPDVIGRAASEGATATMSLDERAANIASLVFAGYETTSKLLAHSVLMLARHPEQRALLERERDRIPAAVEEVLRHCGITMMTPRRAREDVEVHGVTIPAGATVGLMFSTANRDPARWEQPARFDVTRAPKQHYAFGFGLHHCLGQSLARLEADIFLNELLDRLPEWDVPEDIDFGTNFFIRGPKAVPVSAA
ncbi:MAG TPA: cytochrome P450 [Baekduia sp.]|uniref:cytochrome P450 n=1 Tax=Baekduia sp. TaxID=2600305 RepID=UPI002D77055B|nr:cytochrome P450 [Baekduia sp.]HET6509961.1 cytochrome P450 [Baekduia sp.]